MGRKILAICDEQIEYSELLIKRWLREKEDFYQIYSFSTVEQLGEFAEKQDITCLLVSEIYESMVERIKAKYYICLTTEKQKVEEMISGKVQYLYRYQSADQIYSFLQVRFQDKDEVVHMDEHFIENENEVCVLGIYNPVHRNGQTLFAKALARYWNNRGRAALYLSLEEYAGVSREGADHGELGELFFYMKQDIKKMGIRLPNFFHKGVGYDYIEPMGMSQELRNITREEWLALLEVLKERSGYQFIILDLDSCIQGMVEILGFCDQIYMPIRSDVGGAHKREQFFENLKRLHHEDIYNKIIQREVPLYQGLDEESIIQQIESSLGQGV